MRRMIVAFAMVASMAMASTELAAQDWRALVLRQLDAAGEAVRNSGLTDAGVLARSQIIGMLEDGGKSYIEVNLTSGTSYVFAGACDHDCSDLDLRIFDSQSFDELGADIETDDVPVVTYRPSKSGPFLVRVDMADCSEQVCYYGFRVYQQ